MAKKQSNMLVLAASWLFIAGIVLAIIAGFWPLSEAWVIVLIIIGLVVGLLNVTGAEAKMFLFAALTLVVVSYLGGAVLATVWVGLQRMLNAIIVLIIPATIVVAIKQLFIMAKSQ